MNHRNVVRSLIAVLLAAAFVAIAPGTVRGHCDTMDGPVVKAARTALEKNDVDLVLIWVKPADEPAIRDAFQHTLAVRKLGPEARDLADRWFFETLVRLHRAGEGVPFTGLEPAGTDLGPAIPAADKALESGDLTPLTNLLTQAVRERLAERFKTAQAARRFPAHDVAAGRRYIEAYVPFIHQAEAVWQAASHSPEGHFDEAAAEAPAHPGEH